MDSLSTPNTYTDPEPTNAPLERHRSNDSASHVPHKTSNIVPNRPISTLSSVDSTTELNPANGTLFLSNGIANGGSHLKTCKSSIGMEANQKSTIYGEGKKPTAIVNPALARVTGIGRTRRETMSAPSTPKDRVSSQFIFKQKFIKLIHIIKLLKFRTH